MSGSRDGPLSVTVYRSREGYIIDTLEIVIQKLKLKTSLNLEDEDQKLTSTLGAAETKQAAEKQRTDSLEEAAKAAMMAVASQTMIETKKPESMETALKTETLMVESEDALGAFESKKYADAVTALQRMLDKKAPDGVADHCHYWIGESNFGAKKYSEAMRKFDKVLTLKTSVKEGDAQLMIA